MTYAIFIVWVDRRRNCCHLELYTKLTALGVKVLYDDVKESAGKKFASMDLIGLPWQISVGPRGVANGLVELKNRKNGEKEEVSLEQILARFG